MTRFLIPRVLFPPLQINSVNWGSTVTSSIAAGLAGWYKIQNTVNSSFTIALTATTSTAVIYLGRTVPTNTSVPGISWSYDVVSSSANAMQLVTVYTNDPFYVAPVGGSNQTFYIYVAPSGSTGLGFSMTVSSCSASACLYPPPLNSIAPITPGVTFNDYIGNSATYKYYSFVYAPPGNSLGLLVTITPLTYGAGTMLITSNVNVYLSRTAPVGGTWTDETSSIVSSGPATINLISPNTYLPVNGSTAYIKVRVITAGAYSVRVSYIAPSPLPSPGPMTPRPTYNMTTYSTLPYLYYPAFVRHDVNHGQINWYHVYVDGIGQANLTALVISNQAACGVDILVYAGQCCGGFPIGPFTVPVNTSIPVPGYQGLYQAFVWYNTPGNTGPYGYYFIGVRGRCNSNNYAEIVSYDLWFQMPPAPPSASPAPWSITTIFATIPQPGIAIQSGYTYFRFTAFNAGSFVTFLFCNPADHDLYMGVVQPTSTSSFASYSAVSAAVGDDSLITTPASAYYQGQNGVYYIGVYGYSIALGNNFTLLVQYGSVATNSPHVTPTSGATPTSSAPVDRPALPLPAAGISTTGVLAPGQSTFYILTISSGADINVQLQATSGNGLAMAMGALPPVCDLPNRISSRGWPLGYYVNVPTSLCTFTGDYAVAEGNVNDYRTLTMHSNPPDFHYPGRGGILYIQVTNRNTSSTAPNVNYNVGMYYGATNTGGGSSLVSGSTTDSGAIIAAIVVPVIVVCGIIMIVGYLVIKRTYLKKVTPNISWGNETAASSSKEEEVVSNPVNDKKKMGFKPTSKEIE
jgi:hypothetical protein